MDAGPNDFAPRTRSRLRGLAHRWLTRRRLRLSGLAVAIAAAVIVVGLHRHAGIHGDLQVRAGDGTVLAVPEWRLGGESPPSPAGSLSPGTYTFRLANADGVPHDFIVVRTDADPSSLPTSGGQVDLAAAGEVVGRISAVDPGKAAETGQIHLDEGTYVLVCNSPGHYTDGMYYQVTVR